MRGVVPLVLCVVLLLALAVAWLTLTSAVQRGGGLASGGPEQGEQPAEEGPKAPLPELPPEGRPDPEAGAGEPLRPHPAGESVNPDEPSDAGQEPPGFVVLEAHVRDEAGNPAGRIRLRFDYPLQLDEDGDPERGGSWRGASSTAGEDGRVRAPIHTLSEEQRALGARFVLALRVEAGGWALVSPRTIDFPVPAKPVPIVVTRLPELRVQVISAETGEPVAEPKFEGAQFEQDGDWWRLFASMGNREVPITAEGFVPQRVLLAFPPAGSHTRAHPIRLVPGFKLGGFCSSRSPHLGPAADSFIVVESTGTEAGTFRSVSARGNFAFTLPPGSYRLLAFMPGYVPHAQSIALRQDREDLELILRERGSAGPPDVLPYRWADRKTLPIPMAINDLSAAEIVDWIQAIIGAPIRVDADARDKLAKVHASASFEGLPAISALKLLGMLADVEFDEAAGAIRVKR